MGDGGGPATLQEVAERVGLHVSTVSRILNGTADARGRAASQATAQRVRAVADELGHRPNPHAASLRTRRSNLIGVLVPRLSEIVVATVYEGIEEEAAAKGFSTFVTNTHDDPAVQRERIAMVRGRRVDGLIIGDAHLDGAAPAAPGLRGTPFMLVNRRTAGRNAAVTCDDRLAGRLVAEHFLALGHRRVGVIAGEPFAGTGVDRAGGFTEHIRGAGVRIPEHAVQHEALAPAGAGPCCGCWTGRTGPPQSSRPTTRTCARPGSGTAAPHGRSTSTCAAASAWATGTTSRPAPGRSSPSAPSPG